jgi:dTDP-L-rhamnose 4-epimerase
MPKKVLVTGGAGFIGSYIVDALLEAGHTVRVLDNLEPQVHGEREGPPDYLAKEAEFIRGDVRDRETVDRCLEGIEIVFHEAALVGMGQSMYQIARYSSVNTMGAATMLEAIVERRDQIEKMIVASSQSIYGEGRYRKPNGALFAPELRPADQMERGVWEMLTPEGEVAEPVATDETKPLLGMAIYAINKRDHEDMFISVGQAYRIPAVALRYFNVYGPRQALSNPYTGVAAIFGSRLLNGKPPVIYEDGLQRRDFIHVKDIARANLLAMEKKEADYGVFNVGTGEYVTILQVAELMGERLGPGIEPEITGRYRAGDTRHCYSDNTRIRETLGFEPQIPFEKGVDDLAKWVASQTAVDSFDKAQKELKDRGLG